MKNPAPIKNPAAGGGRCGVSGLGCQGRCSSPCLLEESKGENGGAARVTAEICAPQGRGKGGRGTV